MKTRTLKKGGGVGTFISKQFQFESLNDLSTVNDQYEALFLKVFKDKKSLKLFAIFIVHLMEILNNSLNF